MTLTYPTIGATIPGPDDLGELTLDRVLGAGAFGIVFAAAAKRTGATVAVKFLQAGVLSTPHERQALFNEVLAAREVRHEHVLRVLFANLDSPDYPPYIVSEFADGGRLHDRIEDARATKAPIPLEVVAAWALNLIDEMEAINARLLHRDLKPDNILFNADILTVADFGLAKLVGAATRNVTFKGGQHVLYMAPEAWAGQRNEIQLDMYAAGIVLFEMATLEFPYMLPNAGADLDEYRRMHLLQTPRTARSVRADLPQRFSEVLQRLMSKRPEDRYRTWQEVRAAVQGAFGQAAERERPAAVTALIEQANRRHQEAIETRLAAEAQAKERAEQREIDELQERQIVEKLRTLVDAFNAETEGPKASLDQRHNGQYTLTFPYAQRATISFFEVDPPLALDQHRVRFAARVADSNGCGFNLLLRRQPTDQYGEWSMCRVRVNPLTGRIHRNCKYFGFDASEIIEIERGHHAMHVYVPEFSNNVDEALSAFVNELYGSPRK